MGAHFDIAVLGAGPGGYVAALKAAQMGAKVAVVEKGELGGTCLNRGCIPSKALLASAELMHKIGKAPDFGINVSGDVSFDWKKIQARKDKTVETLRGGIKRLLRARRASLFEGEAKLNGLGKVQVGGNTITADKIILAFGSVPSMVPGWPADRNIVCTSDEALNWETLPKSLLIVGGGVIGCEFACMLESFGVKVTIVEMLPGLIPNMDAQLGEALKKIFRKRKIAIHTDTKIDDLKLSGGGIAARLSDGTEIQAERALVATGRRANTRGVGLDSVGIETDRGFIRVNDSMETDVKGYYCIGDANGRCLLAHAASSQGMVAVENALGGSAVSDAPVPECVYTFPEIAAVGMTQDDAEKQGIPVSVGNFPMGYLGKAIAVGDTEGFVKTIRNRETDKLMGVQMMGHNVTECIAAAGALLHEKVSVSEMVEVIFAHPSIGESIKESAEDALYMALHLPPHKAIRVVADE